MMTNQILTTDMGYTLTPYLYMLEYISKLYSAIPSDYSLAQLLNK